MEEQTHSNLQVFCRNGPDGVQKESLKLWAPLDWQWGFSSRYQLATQNRMFTLTQIRYLVFSTFLKLRFTLHLASLNTFCYVKYVKSQNFWLFYWIPLHYTCYFTWYVVWLDNSFRNDRQKISNISCCNLFSLQYISDWI